MARVAREKMGRSMIKSRSQPSLARSPSTGPIKRAIGSISR